MHMYVRQLIKFHLANYAWNLQLFVGDAQFDSKFVT